MNWNPSAKVGCFSHKGITPPISQKLGEFFMYGFERVVNNRKQFLTKITGSNKLEDSDMQKP